MIQNLRISDIQFYKTEYMPLYSTQLNQ